MGKAPDIFEDLRRVGTFKRDLLGTRPSDNALSKAAEVRSRDTVGRWLRGESLPQQLEQLLTVLAKIRAEAHKQGVLNAPAGAGETIADLLAEERWRGTWAAEQGRRAQVTREGVERQKARKALEDEADPSTRPARLNGTATPSPLASDLDTHSDDRSQERSDRGRPRGHAWKPSRSPRAKWARITTAVSLLSVVGLVWFVADGSSPMHQPAPLLKAVGPAAAPDWLPKSPDHNGEKVRDDCLHGSKGITSVSVTAGGKTLGALYLMANHTIGSCDLVWAEFDLDTEYATMNGRLGAGIARVEVTLIDGPNELTFCWGDTSDECAPMPAGKSSSDPSERRVVTAGASAYLTDAFSARVAVTMLPTS
ncbi:hypothetical protein [Kitasatospora azatica]|uniref:hypothetical protein n=1 Tax=Kitasatospora azatica TaxID=58347 RepID=UPI0012FB5C35|nr:hypothetical protein [Kitasatospora azatica]